MSQQLGDMLSRIRSGSPQIRDELSRSCSCQASGPEGCIPCNSVADLLSSLDTTVIYGAMIPGKCGKAQILGRYIQLTPDALVPSKCGCVASTVYHELLHTIVGVTPARMAEILQQKWNRPAEATYATEEPAQCATSPYISRDSCGFHLC